MINAGYRALDSIGVELIMKHFKNFSHFKYELPKITLQMQYLVLDAFYQLVHGLVVGCV